MTRVTVVGDAFLDLDWLGRVDRVCPDSPAPVLDTADEHHRPGGAGLAAVYAAELGAEVTLVTALGDDAEGEQVRTDLAAAGVQLVDLGLRGATPVKLRLRSDGQSLVRVDRNCFPVARFGEWSPAATAAVEGAAAVLVSDYGRGMAGIPALSVLVHHLQGQVPVVWDPHLRGPRPPKGGLDLLTPNLAEAVALTGEAAASSDDGTGTDPSLVAEVLRLAEAASSRFGCAVAVTAGRRGAALAEPGQQPLVLPVQAVQGDPCGAGDRFAASVVVDRSRQVPRDEAAARAVEHARRHVAGELPARADRRPGPRDLESAPAVEGRFGGVDPLELAQRVRSGGGTVVAAGGCFDVLHAGHVRLLASARQLGDCLIVCVNGDLSVRRLKGRGRPINPIEDRITVLEGLGCVDAVLVFDEDTPCEALRTLQPHLFVKGRDYADRDLPESSVLAEWGGRMVLLPLLEGRSTSGILRAAAG